MKFELKQIVEHIRTGATGTVIGRAEYTEKPSTYLVRHEDAAGNQVEQWWTEAAVEAV